ncbi:pyridoxamine 5'-phosphate oxidase [Massilia sp. NR 4-1]|nr:pyridoxamine 5'-phosphate oxidase [Massilia sp. NR 4-1]
MDDRAGIPQGGAPEASPWHAGEQAIQRSIGAAERMDEVGRKVIRRFMPEQHRQFFPQLPFVVVGAVDGAGDVWATLRAGEPGFLQSPDPEHLSVQLGRAPGDPADAGMEEGAAIGLLGIELHTRRRNRLNGRVRHRSAQGFVLDVDESFGNCPQYIHVRDFSFTRAADAPAPEAARLLPGLRLPGAGIPADSAAAVLAARRLIEGAGTFFVASYADQGARRVDVSHRGGAPGFVHLAEDGTLSVPDYTGNRFFSTLGNMLLNGRAGLVFPDFASGGLLQMSGEVEIELDPQIASAAFAGAERLWRFRPRRIVWRAQALPLRWELRSLTL